MTSTRTLPAQLDIQIDDARVSISRRGCEPGADTGCREHNVPDRVVAVRDGMRALHNGETASPVTRAPGKSSVRPYGIPHGVVKASDGATTSVDLEMKR